MALILAVAFASPWLWLYGVALILRPARAHDNARRGPTLATQLTYIKLRLVDCETVWLGLTAAGGNGKW